MTAMSTGAAAVGVGVAAVPAPTRDVVDWRELAACGNRPPAWWDLDGSIRSRKTPESLTDDNRRALWICATCPVARQCFNEALELRVSLSIRGGIALWEPMERYRCAGCRRVDIRAAGLNVRANKRRRYCATCVGRRQSWTQRPTMAGVAA